MKPINEQTREELIQSVTDILEKINSNKNKIDSFENFYNKTFETLENQQSTESKIQTFLDQLQQDHRTVEGLKNNIVNYNNEIFVDVESKPSIKTNLENYSKQIKEDFTAINTFKNSIAEYNNEIFNDIEGRPSLKKQLITFLANIEANNKRVVEIKSDIDAYTNEIFKGTEEKESIKAKIDNLLTNSITKINEISAYHKKILIDDGGNPSFDDRYKQAYDAIIAAHNELLVDEAKKASVKAKIIELHGIAGVVEKEVQTTLEKIKGFQTEVYDKYVDNKGDTHAGLKATTESLRDDLQRLINETSKTLHSLTDKSLHNSFRSRARKYSEEYKVLQKYTFTCIFSIAGITLGFGIAQLINVYSFLQPFSYNMEIYQIGITLPIVYAIWMFNRNQKIAKKLAEEYHHKAALAEAMTGYRALYRLNHDSSEYMNLFNGIKEQLNNNPSSTIDRFLNLKSPTEVLVKKGSDILNTDNLTVKAENVMGK